MNQPVQVVERVFAILEYLSQDAEPKGPTDIAVATGMNKSTVYRLLNSMCRQGHVEKSEQGGHYQIGIKLVGIVSSHINNLELQTEARPLLNELRDALELTVHLGILEGREVVYLERLGALPESAAVRPNRAADSRVLFLPWQVPALLPRGGGV